jgi:uncharacterized membrane protein YhfC
MNLEWILSDLLRLHLLQSSQQLFGILFDRPVLDDVIHLPVVLAIVLVLVCFFPPQQLNTLDD